ncbi:MAG: DUF2800 domain-containing protein [Patescibacteria group bacterium]|nr:DUF2800 domain-containing protein [Patescibacteria group bacterium]
MTEEKKHFKYGGSTIERIGLCPGSVKACEGIDSAGEAAKRGTRIHTLVELLWNEQPAAGEADEILIARAVVEKLAEIGAKYGFSKDEIRIEQQLAMFQTHDDAGGTPDGFAFRAFGDLLVIDLKTGAKKVSAMRNIQEIFYACTVAQNLDPFTLRSLLNLHLVIIQPDGDAQCHVNEWTMPIAELDAWHAYFKSIIDRAEANPDLRVAGEHCRDLFCNARTVCPAYQAWLNEQSLGQLSQALAGEQIKPRGEQLAAWLKIEPHIKDLLKQAEEDAKALLMEDKNAVPGFCLADSFGHYAWNDEKALVKILKEKGLKPAEFTTSKVISMTALAKVLKTKQIELDLSALATRPKTGLKVVEAKEVDQAFAAFAPQA